MMNKAIKYRIYPSKEQQILFAKTFGCVRFVYNKCLDEHERRRANGEKFASRFEMRNFCTHVLKRDYPFLGEVDKFALENAVFHLDDAYRKMFRRESRHPKYKSRRKSRKSYTTNITNNNIAVGDSYIKIPKVKKVKAKIHRVAPKDWVIKSATVSQSGSGKYYVSVLYEYEEDVKLVEPKVFLGMDYRSSGLYMDSDGHIGGSPRCTHKYAKKLAKEQRKLARKKGFSKGERMSQNFIKQNNKVNRIHEKIANSRLDFLHKESLSIAKKVDLVCIEDLDMTEVAHHHEFRNYRKVTYDNGFGIFRKLLAYKLADRGKILLVAEKDFPSTRTCHVCGHILDELDDSVRKWTCVCGHVHDRDLNAAINLKNYAIGQGLPEFKPVEKCKTSLEAVSAKQEARDFSRG